MGRENIRVAALITIKYDYYVQLRNEQRLSYNVRHTV